MSSFKEVICPCGNVAFEVTRLYAEDEVARFNEFYKMLPEDKQEEYYGGHCSDISNYEECIVCGRSYKEFREAKEEEIPFGSTLNPVIRKED
jgi:hypothetical protein